MTLPPGLRVEIAFSTGANPAAWRLGVSALPVTLADPELETWTDVTADVAELVTDRGRARELEEYQPGTCTLTLENQHRRYDPLNLHGPHVQGDPTPAVDLIFVNSQPEQYADLRTLADGFISVYMRSRLKPINGAEILALDAAHTPYFFTAASSDYIVDGETLYHTAGDVATMLARPDVQGLYLHEVATYLASTLGWDWNAAVAALDWSWLDTIIAAAQAAGKRVVWSEAAQGWPTLNTHATAQAHLATYPVGTLVPTYATNFAPHSLVDDAEAGAQAVVAEFGFALGQSHQIWYWLDNSETVTPALSQALAQRGLDAGASVFQFEGPSPYMTWTGDYVLGVRGFVAALEASARTLVRPGRLLRAYATHPVTLVEYPLFSGVIREWGVHYPDQFGAITAQASDVLTDLGATEIDTTIPAGTAGAAATAIMDAAGLAGIVAEAGSSALQATPYQGKAVDALRLVARSEQGHVYTTADGALHFDGRHTHLTRPASATSQATLGGALPFGDLELDYSTRQIRNAVTLTRQGGVAQTARDQDSVDAYGERSYVQDGLATASDTELESIADWLVANYGDAAVRVRGVTLSPMATDALLTHALARELRDRVTVTFAPPLGGSAINQQVWITRIQHRIRRGERMRTTWQFEPVDVLGGWILGVSALGTDAVLTG